MCCFAGATNQATSNNSAHPHLGVLDVLYIRHCTCIACTLDCTVALLLIVTMYSLYCTLFIAGLIPSDIGLSQVVSKIGGKYEEVAVLLGIPRSHASMQSGQLRGLDILVYWRNGKSGQHFPTTWKFLLQKVEEVCGSVVARAIEKALLSEPTWCDGV